MAEHVVCNRGMETYRYFRLEDSELSELKSEWNNGAEIQVLSRLIGEWIDSKYPDFDKDYGWRVKPCP